MKDAARILGQWPKRCGCGRSYVDQDGLGALQKECGFLLWKDLEFAYLYEDAFAKQEARHCACGSTLQVLTEILDASQE